MRYKGGDKKIIIGPDAAVLTYLTAEKSELKPGASVRSMALSSLAAWLRRAASLLVAAE